MLKKMKWLCGAVSLLSLLGMATTAGASTVGFDFTAKIAYISKLIPGTPEVSLDSAYGVNLGEFISGSVRYNTDYMSVNPAYDGPTLRSFSLSNSGTVKIYVGSQTFTKTIKSVYIFNNYNPLNGYYLDRFFADNTAPRTSTDFMSLWIDSRNTNMPSSMLSSTDPTLPGLDFSMADLTQSPITFNTSDFINIDARITTFNRNTNGDGGTGGSGTGTHVPIMDGWWLLPGLMAGIGIFARRRKE